MALVSKSLSAAPAKIGARDCGASLASECNASGVDDIMKSLLISGPNLNSLGARDPDMYGKQTLAEIEGLVQKRAEEWQAEIRPYQSNHEGAIIDFIQQESSAEGLIINPGALAHYGLSLRDALQNFPGQKVEVHLTNIYAPPKNPHPPPPHAPTITTTPNPKLDSGDLKKNTTTTVVTFQSCK